MMIAFRCVILFLFLLSSQAAAQLVLSGSVRDSSTGEPLVAANIRIDGTTRGTITNADGFYRLSLPPGPYRFIFSFIGYRPDTLTVALSRDLRRDITLAPIAIQYGEIVVTDEDPAYRIMRTVIERKHQWSEKLGSYEFEAFTRQVFRRDTAIASITESYTTGYWQRGDTLREVVKQKRQTENIPMSQNFASVGGIVNFYDDEIRFSGFTFVGPTSPEAFDYYAFKLEKIRERNGVELYTILMTPKTRLTPLFEGTINIIGDSYAVVGIDVTPNEAYRIPFVSDLKIRYGQQFALYDGLFWMPVDIRLRGSATIGIAGLSLPPIGFEQVSSIYEYRINVALPDSMLRKPRRTLAAGAEQFDSTFWASKEVLPLTNEEQRAYATLDSTQTLEKQFKPSGPLMVLGQASEGALRYLDLRFNRAEGLFLGGTAAFDSVGNHLKLSGAVGYGFSDKRTKGSLTAEVYLDAKRAWSVGVGIFKDVLHFPDEGFYNAFSISLSALLDKVDQRDYFYGQGWKIFVTGKPFARLSGRLTYTSESEQSAIQRTDFSLFNRSSHFRAQPPIDEGMMRSVSLSLRYGSDPVPLGLISSNFLEIDAERSERRLLRSDFSFSRLSVVGEFFVPTFLKRNLFPPTLLGRVSVGVSDGMLPPQRIFTLEGRSIGYGPMGVLRGAALKEFIGDSYVMVSLEHNFRSIPFLAVNIPFLYENSIEFLIHASAAKSWLRPQTRVPYGHPTDGWYSEAGFGLSRLFGLLRVDLTRRFVPPASWHVTIAVARIL